MKTYICLIHLLVQKKLKCFESDQILLTMIKSKILSNKLAYLSMVIDIDNLMWPNFFELAAELGNSAIQ